MLWQKQRDGNGDGETVYVDIFEKNKIDMKACQAKVISEFLQSDSLKNSMKDDATSTTLREEGNNLLMRSGDLDAAILKYNTAILFAEPDSENLGMSYANRAICFMGLKKYSMCLRDIQLAKQNGYPIRSFQKLDERKAKCLKLMEDSENEEPLQCIEKKLSFSPNDKNPCFASGIEVKRSPDGRKRTITERNLEIGQTIIIEEPYEMVSEYAFAHHQCLTCLKTDANLIPCSKCTRAMFCSRECYDVGHEKFHNIECSINYRFINGEPIRRSVLRTILVAIQTFGTIEALMDAIELFNRRQEVIDDTDVAKRNYFEFFRSRGATENLPALKEFALHSFALSMYIVLRTESILKFMFVSDKNQRFLAHLILHHFYVINRNAFGANSLAEHTYKAELGLFNGLLGKPYANAVPLSGQCMNHSCVPNVARIFAGHTIIYKVLRPIKSGEELFITYIHPMASLCITAIRKQSLSADYPLKCECIACSSDSPPFKNSGNTQMDASLTQLLSLLQGFPQKHVKRLMSVDRNKLKECEQSIVEHLQHTDHLHPNEATLKLQFLLMQIWNNQYAVFAV